MKLDDFLLTLKGGGGSGNFGHGGRPGKRGGSTSKGYVGYTPHPVKNEAPYQETPRFRPTDPSKIDFQAEAKAKPALIKQPNKKNFEGDVFKATEELGSIIKGAKLERQDNGLVKTRIEVKKQHPHEVYKALTEAGFAHNTGTSSRNWSHESSNSKRRLKTVLEDNGDMTIHVY